MTELREQGVDRGAASYGFALRTAVRGLWAGSIDDIQAWESFEVTITRYFTLAYTQGSAEVGIAPAEWTPEERMWLSAKIQEEKTFIDGFLNAIEAGSKANGGKLAPLLARVDMWVKRYLEVFTQGMLTAKNDPKLMWVWHPEAEHCSSCERLQGRVYRQSRWQKSGLYPQSPALECMKSAGGVTVCKCHFEVTTAPGTRGPIPRV